jgi:hypothetical protein
LNKFPGEQRPEARHTPELQHCRRTHVQLAFQLGRRSLRFLVTDPSDRVKVIRDVLVAVDRATEKHLSASISPLPRTIPLSSNVGENGTDRLAILLFPATRTEQEGEEIR